jgi:hypothetical protein
MKMTAAPSTPLRGGQPLPPSFTLHSHDFGGQLAPPHYANGLHFATLAKASLIAYEQKP